MKSKGRPRKKKIIKEHPRTDFFKPDGFGGVRNISKVAMEEYEAIRLQDYLGIQQKDAADMMGISQQSFSRIIRTARKKLSDAIVNAKTIKIEGGDFVNKRSLDVVNKLKRKFVEV